MLTPLLFPVPPTHGISGKSFMFILHRGSWLPAITSYYMIHANRD